MDQVKLVLRQDPWGGPGTNTTTFGVDADQQGMMGPVTVHLDPELWTALGEPSWIHVTVDVVETPKVE